MKKILLIEDDAGIRDAVKYALEYAGYGVTIVSNGADVVNGDFSTPHLFIIDKQLSGIDGLDICKSLRARETYRHIPIIIISASPWVAHMIQDIENAVFLEKPFSMGKLKETVAQHLK